MFTHERSEGGSFASSLHQDLSGGGLISKSILGNDLNKYLACTFRRRFQTVWLMREKIRRKADKAFVADVKYEIERCDGEFIPTTYQNMRICNIESSLKRNKSRGSFINMIEEKANEAFESRKYQSLEPGKKKSFIKYHKVFSERELNDKELSDLQYLLCRLDELHDSE